MTRGGRSMQIFGLLCIGVMFTAGAATAVNDDIANPADASVSAERVYERYPVWDEACHEVGLVDDSGTRTGWELLRFPTPPPSKYILWDVDADRSDDVFVDPAVDRYVGAGWSIGTPHDRVIADPWCRYVVSPVPFDYGGPPPPHLDPFHVLFISLDESFPSDSVEVLPHSKGRLFAIDVGPIYTSGQTGHIDAVLLDGREVVHQWHIPPGFSLLDVSADGQTLLLDRVGDFHFGAALQQGSNAPIILSNDGAPSMSPSGNHVAILTCPRACDLEFRAAPDGTLRNTVRITSERDVIPILGWQMRTDDSVVVCTAERLISVHVDGTIETIESFSPPLDYLYPTADALRCITSLRPTPHDSLPPRILS